MHATKSDSLSTVGRLFQWVRAWSSNRQKRRERDEDGELSSVKRESRSGTVRGGVFMSVEQASRRHPREDTDEWHSDEEADIKNYAVLKRGFLLKQGRASNQWY